MQFRPTATVRHASCAVGFSAALLVACLSLCALGCRGDDALLDVSGQVLHNDQPVPAGRIDFRPDSAQGSQGPAGYAIVANGEYDTQRQGRGVKAGHYRVVVEGFDGQAGSVEGYENGAPLFAPYETSIEVGPDRREFDFSIPDDPTE